MTGDDDNNHTEPDSPPTDEQPTVPEAVASRSASKLGERYPSGEVIGRGGMGEVVSARDVRIGRDVAVKRMRGKAPSESAIQRFLREAQIQGRLDHPAIVPVHDLGRDRDGLPFFAMKKLTGITLVEILTSDRLATKYPQQQLLRAFVDVCLAVELAHTRGVVHRDIKPHNLVLGDFGEVYVLDWGVAKIIGETEGEFADVMHTGTLETAAGSSVGTPGYMAPEQVRGEPDIDGRADVYSLGCVLFEILAGTPLHPPGKAGLDSALTGVPVRPSERAPDRGIPPELDALCLRATAADRTARLATARELGERVQEFLDGDRDVSLRRELARQHLAAAHAAFASGDQEAERSLAMREAGRALALDPTLEGAAELVGRLMLEPPRAMPRDVATALATDEITSNRSQARTALWLYLGYFGFAPFLIDFRGTQLYLLAFVGLVVFNAILIWRRAYRDVARHGIEGPVVVILANAALLGLIAHLFSPILLAPGLAAITTAALVNAPLYPGSIHDQPNTKLIGFVVVAMIAAVLVPWGAEVIDLVPRTFEITDHGPVFFHRDLHGGAVTRTLGQVLYVIALIAIGASIAYFVRRTERESRRLLHLHAWHLRQLVSRN